MRYLVQEKEFTTALIRSHQVAIDVIAKAARDNFGIITAEHGRDLAASCCATDATLAHDIGAAIGEGNEAGAIELAREHLGTLKAVDPAAFENAPDKLELFRHRCRHDNVPADPGDWRFFEIGRMGQEELRREAYRLTHGEIEKNKRRGKKAAVNIGSDHE